MNRDIIKGHWNELKGKVKQQWGELTDDDVTKLEGNFDELAGVLQKKYGYQKDEAEKEIDAFVKTTGFDKSH